MQRAIVLAALICFAPLAAALTPEQLEAARQAAAARAAAAAGLDLSGGGAPVASAPVDYCVRGAPGGGISLLGVQSQMGPSTQGLAPSSRLANEHPAKQALNQFGYQLGMYADPPNSPPDVVASNAAARQRRAAADAYQFYLDARAIGNNVLADFFAFLNADDMVRMAEAHKAYSELALRYAALQSVADSAGSACP